MSSRRNAQEPSGSTNPFVGSPRPREPDELRAALGRSAAARDALRSHIAAEFGPLSEEWALPARKYGRSFRLKLTKRTILHMGPRSKHFIAGVIPGEKGVEALVRIKMTS